MGTQTDDRLVRLAGSGDGAAFEEIYARYHQPVYRYALSILRDPQDAQDALQSTMERAFRSTASQRVPGGLRAWLFGIAHNEAMDVIQRRRGTPAPEGPVLAADAAADAGTRDRVRQLVSDLGTLPVRQRSALVMRELSGLDSEEIATALSISPSAARQSVYEARAALSAMADGRDMNCERVQERISAGDGRRLRGRRVRAHVRDCAICRAFTAGIGRRTTDLPLLFPPLAATAAAETYAAATGGGAASLSTAGGSAEGSVASADRGSMLRDRRAAAAGIGVIALLALGGALGAIGTGDDPADEVERAAQAPPSSPDTLAGAEPPREPTGPAADAQAPSTPQDPAARSGAGAGSPTWVRSPTVSGYTALDPDVAALLDAEGPGADDIRGSPSAGADGAHGADGTEDSDGSLGSLAFTGLETLVLVALGLALLGLGVGMRRVAGRPL